MDERDSQTVGNYLERQKQYLREYQRKNKERIKEQRAKFYRENRERIRAEQQAYYDAHKDDIVQQKRDIRGQSPRVLEAREKREFFKGRPWTRNLFWKHRAILSWQQFKELYPRIVDGPCEVCGKTGEKMRIDHCHKRNVFRGLLCHKCNVLFGHCNDDPAILRKAIAYLDRTNRSE